MTVIVKTPEGPITLENGVGFTKMLTVHDAQNGIIGAYHEWEDVAIIEDDVQPVSVDNEPEPETPLIVPVPADETEQPIPETEMTDAEQ